MPKTLWRGSPNHAEDLRARLFAEPTEQAASNVIIGWLCGNLPRGNHHARYIITDAAPATTAVLHATVELLGYCISCSLVNVHNHLVLQVSLKKFYRCSRAAVASNGRGATFIHGNSGRIGRIGGGPGVACSAFLRYWTESIPCLKYNVPDLEKELVAHNLARYFSLY